MNKQNYKNKIWILSTIILAIVLTFILARGWNIGKFFTALVGSTGQQEEIVEAPEPEIKELENCTCGCDMELDSCDCSTARELKSQSEKEEVQPARPSSEIIISDNDHIRGEKNAPITLVEFSDFQCPYCKRFHPTMQKVMKEYKGKVRWIYRHFPLGFHQNAQKSAEASECAGEQGRFWEYVDKSFENSQADGAGLNTKDLKKYAQELGLDANKFDDCLASNKFASKVKADMASGQAVGVTGTPGTILIDKNGNIQLISGALSYAQIKAKIDAALK